jgi:hypothetical protein
LKNFFHLYHYILSFCRLFHVEHRRLNLVIVIMLLTILVSACRKEEANPEFLDPIYSDLDKERLGALAAKETSEKSVEADEKALEKTAPRTIDRRNAEEELSKEQTKLMRITQFVEYLTIRTERRRVESRRDYKLAFLANKPWPDPKEYQDYLTHKRLVESSRNWSDRVPKLTGAVSAPAEEAPTKSSGGEGEGGSGGGGEGGSHGGTKEGIHHN